jgi:hypothetical protein
MSRKKEKPALTAPLIRSFSKNLTPPLFEVPYIRVKKLTGYFMKELPGNYGKIIPKLPKVFNRGGQIREIFSNPGLDKSK